VRKLSVVKRCNVVFLGETLVIDIQDIPILDIDIHSMPQVFQFLVFLKIKEIDPRSNYSVQEHGV